MSLILGNDCSFSFSLFFKRIYWKYDDQWIIGKREWEIVERYGKFDYETKPGARKGYYIGQKNHFLKLMVKVVLLYSF